MSVCLQPLYSWVALYCLSVILKCHRAGWLYTRSEEIFVSECRPLHLCWQIVVVLPIRPSICWDSWLRRLTGIMPGLDQDHVLSDPCQSVIHLSSIWHKIVLLLEASLNRARMASQATSTACRSSELILRYAFNARKHRENRWQTATGTTWSRSVLLANSRQHGAFRGASPCNCLPRRPLRGFIIVI